MLKRRERMIEALIEKRGNDYQKVVVESFLDNARFA